MPRGLYASDSVEWHEIERALPAGPLGALLRHSDCGGIIPAADCKPLALALIELLPKIPTGPKPINHREDAITFISGLLRAHAAGEDVEFH